MKLQSSADHRNCRAQNRLWQSAEQMLMCLRVPEGCLCASFMTWSPSWVPKPQSYLCWDAASEELRVEAHGCVRFADPMAQQSYLTSQFHSYSSVPEWSGVKGWERNCMSLWQLFRHLGMYLSSCTYPVGEIQSFWCEGLLFGCQAGSLKTPLEFPYLTITRDTLFKPVTLQTHIAEINLWAGSCCCSNQ